MPTALELKKKIQVGIEVRIAAGIEASINHGIGESIKIGIEQAALHMLQRNVDINFISDITGLSVAQAQME